MSDPSFLGLRDLFRRFIPWWLSDRRISSGKWAGYRLLWVVITVLDIFADVAYQSLLAAWPGKGTPTALALIGRNRGIIRGQLDTDATYSAKLRNWLDRAREWGGMLGLAVELRDYLPSSDPELPPKVTIINRAGDWLIASDDGVTITRTTAAWDWDSVTHPERSSYWSDLWVIIHLPKWANRTGGLGDLTGDDGYALGHMVRHQEVDAIKGIIAQVKGAHSRVRCVVWCTDPDWFQPGGLDNPDGTWGAWSMQVAGSQVASGRHVNFRYWEP